MTSDGVNHDNGALPLAEADAVRWRNDPLLSRLPGLHSPASAVHLSLAELQALVAEHRRLGESWVFAEHLGVCPVCLDVFQCLLDGVPEAGQVAQRRFESLWREAGLTAPPVMGTLRSWPLARRIMRVAAVLAILLGVATAVHIATRSPLAAIQAGALQTLRGPILHAGDPFPDGSMLEAVESVQVSLAGGSYVAVDALSRLAVDRSLAGSMRIRLAQGRIEAAVVRQTMGRQFTVTTPLGDVRVIGTRFQVAVNSEDVTVYEQSGNAGPARKYRTRVASVSVTVKEGVVSVHARRDRVKVSAGQTAVIREGQPLIDVK